MKKIFSFMLIAAGLLISGQVKAVNVSTEAQLRSAIDNAGAGETINIVLSNDIQLAATIQIAGSFVDSKKVVNLDLNGKTLSNNPTTANISVIELYKGELNISNGTVKCAWAADANKCKDGIIVHGVYQDMPDWAILNIKKDAKVIADKNAITVLEFWGPDKSVTPAAEMSFPTGYYDSKAFELYKPFTLSATGALESFSGNAWVKPTPDLSHANEMKAFYFFAYPSEVGGPNPGLIITAADTASTNKYNQTTNPNGWLLKGAPAMTTSGSDKHAAGAKINRPDCIDYTSSVPHYAKENLYCETSRAATTARYSHVYACYRYYESAQANGVKINVDGYVFGTKYGIKVNGPIRNAGENAAKIVVSSTGEVACSAEKDAAMQDKESTAIYCSGVAEWTLNGYIHGNIGVVVKSGEVTIENATIEATGVAYEPVTYEGGSGLNGGAGCAIVVASQSNYSGGQDVTIKGDTKISANTGFAVNEVIVNGENKVSEIDIQGGTFESGAEGTMLFTNETVSEGKIKIVGGNIDEGIYKDNGATEITIESLLDNTSTTHYVTTVEVDEVKTFVVNTGTEPAEVAFENIPVNGSAKVAAGTPTLSTDKKFGDLQFLQATTLTLDSGVTMQAEKIIMGATAQIIVNQGAKLVINGLGGMYAPVEENLVIKADKDGMGYFIFNPQVASNRTPHATVEVYAKNAFAYGNKTGYSFDIIVSPLAAVSSISYELDPADVAEGETGKWTNTQIWKNNKWNQLTRAQAAEQLQAFQPIALSSSAKSTVGTKFIFKGELQGNVSGIMPIGKNYNWMGNAYLAPMSSDDLFDKIEANSLLHNSVWVWQDLQYYESYNRQDISEIGGFQPLRMFILKSSGDVNFDIDYEKLIWDFNQQ